jgi:hypothetical protein
MNRLQQEIFEQTKRLIGTINLIRIFFYTVISAAMLIIVLSIFNMLSLQMGLLTVGISMLYSLIRDVSITRYSAKQLDKYYDYADDKFDQMTLYIPLLEKTYQGYFLKRAALIINDDKLYLEAFRQKRKQNQDQISISVPYGDKFIIDYQEVDKNMKSISIDSTFSGQYYRFSIVNHKQILDQINRAKKGGK